MRANATVVCLHAVGHQRLHALDDEAPPHLALELAPVALALQERFEPLAVEAAAVLELGQADDGIEHLRVGHVDAEAGGLVVEERLLDQLVERMPAQVERAGELGGPLTAQHLLVPTL
jgi:hypothetical protein